MRMRFFFIPVRSGPDAANELNRFLASHRILSVDSELVQDDAASCWAVRVSYSEGETKPASVKKGSIDYRDVLSETDFAVFAKLRSLRKELAS